ncbi:MAG: hypothetical protein HW416_2439 [Chloroflexi bacterium]|nr:hypothetical protein [Chloroflexota bacterium]
MSPRGEWRRRPAVTLRWRLVGVVMNVHIAAHKVGSGDVGRPPSGGPNGRPGPHAIESPDLDRRPVPQLSATPFRASSTEEPRDPLDEAHLRLYKDPVKTLTITDARKNLGRWLAAAAQGEDIGIVCGADIIALRKVEVDSTDYAQREYGGSPDQVSALDNATDRRYRSLKRSGNLVTVTAEELNKLIG